MRQRFSLDGVWRGAFGVKYPCAAQTFSDCGDMTEIRATVPGALETDLEAAGILPELFRGENILGVQDYENVTYCLSRTFTYRHEDGYADTLVFEGLDCYAAIYIDGEACGCSTNMLIPYAIPLGEANGGFPFEDGEH